MLTVRCLFVVVVVVVSVVVDVRAIHKKTNNPQTTNGQQTTNSQQTNNEQSTNNNNNNNNKRSLLTARLPRSSCPGQRRQCSSRSKSPAACPQQNVKQSATTNIKQLIKSTNNNQAIDTHQTCQTGDVKWGRWSPPARRMAGTLSGFEQDPAAGRVPGA